MKSNLPRWVKSSTLVLVSLLLVFCLRQMVFPQSTTATLSGTVMDQTGAVVPGAVVVILNPATGAQRQVTTSNEGYFVFPLLAPGNYTVTAQHDGFSPVEMKNIILNVNDQRSLLIQLKVGSVNQSVAVEASSSGIELGGGTATVVSRGFVENTALNGRSFQPLLLMTPGAVLSLSDGGISVNGMRSDMNYFTVDGISANAGVNNASLSSYTGADAESLSGAIPALNTFGGTQAMLGLDAMEEFKVQTSAISAEYGRQMGAQVQLTSRSGTNSFHGSAFDYLRNDALDAKPNYPAAPTTAKPRMRQNNFGGTFGGPIIKDKTFFFFSYEGQRNVLPNASNVWVVPSVALRNGDSGLLSEWLASGYPTVATSSSKMPSSVMALLKMFPLPNIPCPNALPAGATAPSDPMNCVGSYSYKNASGQTVKFFARNGTAYWLGLRSDQRGMDNWSIKLDHSLSAKLTSFLRYSQSGSRGESASRVMSQTTTSNWSKTATLGLSWLLTNSLSNSLRANFTETSGGATYGIGDIHDGGVAPGSNSILDPLIANFTYGQISTSAGIFNVGANRNGLNRQWNVVDALTWFHGKHSVRTGIDWRYLFPKLPAYTYASTIMSSNLPDMYSNTFSYLYVQFVNGATVVTKNYSTYVQDTWRAAPRLTLDLGLRWEINPAPQGRNPGDLRYITGWSNPSTITLAPAGTSYYDTPWRALAPRLGVSYQLFNRAGWETVLRGGWGVFYDSAGSYAVNAAGYYPLYRANTPVNAATSLDSFSTSLTMRPAPPTEQPPYPSNQSFMGRMDKFAGLPKSYQWNISLQQSLGRSQVVTASYVANLGRDMMRFQYMLENGSRNQLTHDFANANFPSGAFYINRNDSGWGDASDYQSLQLQYQRRMSKGLEALANWTWAHAIDTNSITTPSGSTSSVNKWQTPTKYRGNSDFDRRHVLNFALTYEVPKLASLGPVSAPVAKMVRTITNGWSFNTNFKAQTGTPMTVYVNRYMLPYDNQNFTARADLVSGQPIWIYDPKAPAGRYLNPNAFAVPASCMTLYPQDCQNGTSARNGIRGFGFWQADASVRRIFPITERVKMEFRADFFNLLNHPNWANPSTNLGYISTTYNSTTLVPTATTFTRYAVGPSLGYTNSMLANSIGGGLISMYQQGGARSIQLALMLKF